MAKPGAKDTPDSQLHDPSKLFNLPKLLLQVLKGVTPALEGYVDEVELVCVLMKC